MNKLIILLALLFSTLSYGASLHEFFGSVGKHNSLNSRVFPTSGDASYFNPSMLPFLKSKTDISFFIIHQNLDITYKKRPDGSDITERIYDAKKIEPNGNVGPIEYKPYPTSFLSKRGSLDPDYTNSYLAISVTKEIIKDKLE